MNSKSKKAANKKIPTSLRPTRKSAASRSLTPIGTKPAKKADPKSVTAAKPIKKSASSKSVAASKSAVSKSIAAKSVAAKSPSRKKVATKTSGTKQLASKKSTPKKPAPRADFGAPIDGFFAKQPPQFRVILETLRKMVEEAAPDAESSIKWGMPFFSIGRGMMCALTGHKSHVNLVLSGPPTAYVDPDGLLTGAGKSGRHLKLTSIEELPRAKVRAWLRTAAVLARADS